MAILAGDDSAGFTVKRTRHLHEFKREIDELVGVYDDYKRKITVTKGKEYQRQVCGEQGILEPYIVEKTCGGITPVNDRKPILFRLTLPANVFLVAVILSKCDSSGLASFLSIRFTYSRNLMSSQQNHFSVLLKNPLPLVF